MDMSTMGLSELLGAVFGLLMCGGLLYVLPIWKTKSERPPAFIEGLLKALREHSQNEVEAWEWEPLPSEETVGWMPFWRIDEFVLRQRGPFTCRTRRCLVAFKWEDGYWAWYVQVKDPALFALIQRQASYYTQEAHERVDVLYSWVAKAA